MITFSYDGDTITLPVDQFGSTITLELETVTVNRVSYLDTDWPNKRSITFKTNPFPVNCYLSDYSTYDEICSFIEASLGQIITQTGLPVASTGFLMVEDLQETREGYIFNGRFTEA